MKTIRNLTCVVYWFALAGVSGPLAANAERGSGHEDRIDRLDERSDRIDRIDRDIERDLERAERDAAEAAERAARDIERAELEAIKNEIDALEEAEKDLERIERAESESSDSGSGSSDEDDSDNSGSGNSEDDIEDEEDESSRDEEEEEDKDDDRDKDEGEDFIEFDDMGHAFRDKELVLVSDDADIRQRLRAKGFSIVESRALRSTSREILRLKAPEGLGSSEALRLLRQIEPDAASGFNHIYRPSGESPTSKAATPKINAFHGPNTGRVAVIDGFGQDVISGFEVFEFGTSRAHQGHGDAVWLILFSNLVSIRSSAPERVVLCDVVERMEDGSEGATVVALIDALDFALSEGAQVINVSLAGPDNPALSQAIETARAAGSVIVAAVGNQGPAAPPAYPAAYAGVYGVTAVDVTGQPYIYAGRGAHVDFASLGVNVSVPGHEDHWTGTSFAAPAVSALILDLINSDAGYVEQGLFDLALDAGAPGRDDIFGHGILSPSGQLELVAEHSE